VAAVVLYRFLWYVRYPGSTWPGPRDLIDLIF